MRKKVDACKCPNCESEAMVTFEEIVGDRFLKHNTKIFCEFCEYVYEKNEAEYNIDVEIEERVIS